MLSWGTLFRCKRDSRQPPSQVSSAYVAREVLSRIRAQVDCSAGAEQESARSTVFVLQGLALRFINMAYSKPRL